MLILVGVTINVALNGGLFDKAKNASDQTQKAVSKEELIAAMVGAYDSNGNFVKPTDLPSGAKWCKEGETYANATNDPDECEWIVTETGNKFYIDESGSVLDEKSNEISNSDSIYDVAYVYSDESYQDVIILKNESGTTVLYTLYYDNGTLDISESDKRVVTIGSKEDYETEIKEDYFPSANFVTEIRDEVIVDDGEIWMVFKVTESQEILNSGKDEYIREDDFVISEIPFSSIN